MSLIENVKTGVGNMINGFMETPQTDTTTSKEIAPVQDTTPTAQEPENGVVSGKFVEDKSAMGPATSVNISEAFNHTNNFRKVVESFDEDRQTRLEWVVGKLFNFIAYIFPSVIAYIVGMAIGDGFSNRFNLADTFNLYAHAVSVGIEIGLVMLMLGTVIVFRRALKDRSQIGLFIGLAVLFIVLSVLNSFAQLFLLEKHIAVDIHNLVPFVAVVFRSFASTIIDIICALYLGVTGARSLKKYLQDKKAQIEAVRDVNQVEIEMGQTRMKAAMDMQSAMMDMASKAQRASTWNEIEALQSKQMIEQAKRNMRQAGDEGGSYRRSRY